MYLISSSIEDYLDIFQVEGNLPKFMNIFIKRVKGRLNGGKQSLTTKTGMLSGAAVFLVLIFSRISNTSFYLNSFILIMTAILIQFNCEWLHDVKFI